MKLDSSLSTGRFPTTSRAWGETRAAAQRWLGAAVVGALTLLYAVVNWAWLRANVVTYGWDRMDHLISTLAYNDILRSVNLHSLFAAFAWSDYYPPLVHLVAVAGYKLFGVNEDVAALTNLIYFAILLGAVWNIARRTAGPAVALLATLVVPTFPMIFAMSRYLYLDFALTGLVAASVATLLASERFTRRGPALLFGLALGAAFLVKWTVAAFLAVPLAVVLWRSGALVEAVRHPTALRPDGRRLAVAVLIGLVLASLWVWPARDVAVQQPLGLVLIPLFGLLTAGVVYALLSAVQSRAAAGGEEREDRRGKALANALSAGAVGALTLSLWYLPNVNFLLGFYINAYGKPAGRIWAYDKYLNYIVTEQLSPLYTAVFVLLAAAFLWAWAWRGGLRRLFVLDDTTLVLLAWAVVPFLIFSSRVSTAHSRYLMPFLPPFAIWIAAGLWRLRPVALRTAAVALVLLLGWAQFAVISFDGLDAWRHRFVVSLPTGPVDLLGHGFSIQYPAVGVTNPGFAIAPDALSILERDRQARGRERVTLGLVVNAYQLHEKHFLYQIYTHFPRVLLRELARNWSGRPTYPQLFEMDYVLLDDTHTYRTAEESQRVTERILTHPDDLFNQAFRERHRWDLPSGETILLYERRFAETQPGISPETYQTFMQTLGPELGEGDALILTAPDQAYIMGLLMPEEVPVQVAALPAGGVATEASIATLRDLAQHSRRLFLLSRNSTAVDPSGQIEGWLRANTLPGPEVRINDLRVVAFAPGTPASTAAIPLNAGFAETGVKLAGATLGGMAGTVQPGGTLPLTLFWEAPGDLADLKLFVQLLGPDGALVAQRDTTLSDGVQPNALFIPRAAVPGAYRLIVGLYRDSSGQRLAATLNGRPLPDRAVPIGTIRVGAPR
ncbi:MAG: glycosyltransferase family 39 protein [Ardenticatenaceae bacterium]|nr:glycosyltransferase family 39 protein [Ardenticatenaceae bacterium]